MTSRAPRSNSASTDESAKVQSIDSIAAAGHARGFCMGSIQKYAARQGKKKGEERKDLFKILHYAIFALHYLDKENKDEDQSS